MSEPEGVKAWFACGPGMCDMDAATTSDGLRIFAGGAEGMVKVGTKSGGGEAVYDSLSLFLLATMHIAILKSRNTTGAKPECPPRCAVTATMCLGMLLPCRFR